VHLVFVQLVVMFSETELACDTVAIISPDVPVTFPTAVSDMLDVAVDGAVQLRVNTPLPAFVIAPSNTPSTYKSTLVSNGA
jgi:hypothetical protein